MKYSFLKKDRKRSLVLFFAGWSMDATPFNSLSQLDCDSVVVYDYTNLSLEKNILDGYANVFVFAWSFGVYAAAYWLRKENLSPLMAIAINGTLSPIDDELGIPVGVFNGTLENLSEKSLQKFYRRMCLSAEQYAEFMSTRPKRGLESLRSELISIRDLSVQRPEVFKSWTKAYVADDDRIFPVANQTKAWETAPFNQPVLISLSCTRPTFQRIWQILLPPTLLTSGSSSNTLKSFCQHTTHMPYVKAVLLKHFSGNGKRQDSYPIRKFMS